jgi:alanine racemase
LFNRSEWAIERGFELEDLAAHRLDLDAVQAKLRAVEAAQVGCLAHLEEIEEEKHRRELEMAAKLEAALQRRGMEHNAEAINWKRLGQSDKKDLVSRSGHRNGHTYLCVCVCACTEN